MAGWRSRVAGARGGRRRGEGRRCHAGPSDQRERGSAQARAERARPGWLLGRGEKREKGRAEGKRGEWEMGRRGKGQPKREEGEGKGLRAGLAFPFLSYFLFLFLISKLKSI
jgi:hypothetical protein